MIFSHSFAMAPMSISQDHWVLQVARPVPFVSDPELSAVPTPSMALLRVANRKK